MSEEGILQGPFTYQEWLEYGHEQIDDIYHLVETGEDASWAGVYFREPSQHYAG